jgi:hypothetical protein
MYGDCRRVKKITETVNVLLKRAEKRKKAIVEEIRATNEYLQELIMKKRTTTRHAHE